MWERQGGLVIGQLVIFLVLVMIAAFLRGQSIGGVESVYHCLSFVMLFFLFLLLSGYLVSLFLVSILMLLASSRPPPALPLLLALSMSYEFIFPFAPEPPKLNNNN